MKKEKKSCAYIDQYYTFQYLYGQNCVNNDYTGKCNPCLNVGIYLVWLGSNNSVR